MKKIGVIDIVLVALAAAGIVANLFAWGVFNIGGTGGEAEISDEAAPVVEAAPAPKDPQREEPPEPAQEPPEPAQEEQVTDMQHTLSDGRIGLYTGILIGGSAEDLSGKLVLEGIGVYTGGFKDNNFNGSGTMEYSNGGIYTGGWSGGMRQGQGDMVYAGGGGSGDAGPSGLEEIYGADNSAFMGEWTNAEYGITYTFTANGQCFYESAASEGLIKGEFSIAEDGMATVHFGMFGDAPYTTFFKVSYPYLYQYDESGYKTDIYLFSIDTAGGSADIAKQKGTQPEGEQIKSDRGTSAISGGEVYTGQWENDKRHGEGTLFFARADEDNRYQYAGQWEDDLRHGRGKLIWKDGEYYDGEWENDRKSGEGTYVWNNTARYTGQWKDDERNGEGTMEYRSGDKYNRVQYSGMWADGKANGQGTLTWKDGHIYTGEFADELRQGRGTQTWADGNIYTGQWEDDRMHGQGSLTFANGKVWSGEWKKDKFVG